MNFKELREEINFLSGVKCPSCSSKMNIKVASRGEHNGKEFFGCSTFPVCRSILDISEQKDPYVTLSYQTLLTKEKLITQNLKTLNKKLSEIVNYFEEKEHPLNVNITDLSNEISYNDSLINKQNNTSWLLVRQLFGITLCGLCGVFIYFQFLLLLPEFLAGFFGIIYFWGLGSFWIGFLIYNKIYRIVVNIKSDDQLNEMKRKKSASLIIQRSKYQEDLEKVIEEKSKTDEQTTSLRKEINKNSIILDYINILKPKARSRERTAIISAYEDRARTGTQTIKQQLLNMFPESFNCPYCSATTFRNDAEADHIFPVSKGGLTTLQNMVLICRDCNSRKSNFTLRSFARRYNYNYDEICDRLENLGKDI